MKNYIISKANLFVLILSLLTTILFTNCEKQLPISNSNAGVVEKKKGEYIKGAKKLKNPYTTKNMNKALERVKKNVKDKKIKFKGVNARINEEELDTLEFETSHLYLKFIPVNKEEEDEIASDSTFFAFDYPLDYDYTEEFFENREIPSDSIRTFYTSVPIEQELNVTSSSELIEELYIPEEDPFFASIDDGINPVRSKDIIYDREDILMQVLYEAYSLTGNEKELIPEGADENSMWIFGHKWYPSGTIEFWDEQAGSTTNYTQEFSHMEYYYCDTGLPAPPPGPPVRISGNNKIDEIEENICERPVYNYIQDSIPGKYVPLEGAQVLMRQWFTVRQGITDENGYFKTKAVRGSAQYVIQWERYHYDIRDGLFFQAELRGPKKTDEAWNKKIKGGKGEYHAMIHTAAHWYYYSDRLGLQSPRRKLGNKRIDIAAYDYIGTSSHISSRTIIGGPEIIVKQYGSSSDRIFGVTIHELTHSAHQELDYWAYSNLATDGYIFKNRGDKAVMETWAETVELVATLERYENKFGNVNYQYRGNLQTKSVNLNDPYTSLGYDLIDTLNQNSINISRPIDNVNSFTINEIENSLKGVTGWDEWKNSLKQKYPNNPTFNSIDELFNNWNF